MDMQTKMMRAIGNFYERLHGIPVVGDPLVRFIVRGIARMAYYNPLLGIKRQDSIQEVKAEMIRLTSKGGINIEIGAEGPDWYEFFVPECPYGYCRPEQRGVCDAAMDMDRYLFRYCGADLIIEEAIVDGAPKCRITMRKI